MDPIPIWIAAFSTKSLRSRGSLDRCNRRLVLPPTPYLIQLLRNYGLADLLRRTWSRSAFRDSDDATLGPYVCALALVRPGSDCSRGLSEQELVLQQFFRVPVYSMEVVEVYKCTTPKYITAVRPQPNGPLRMWGQPQIVIATPPSPDWGDLELQLPDGSLSTAAQVLAAGGHGLAEAVRIAPVVEPIALLLQRLAWRMIACPYRWQLPAHTWHDAWPAADWPPAMQPIAEARTQALPATARLAQMMTSLTAVLRDPNLPNDARAHITSALDNAEQMALELTPGCAEEDYMIVHTKVHRQWTSEALLSTALISYHTGHRPLHFVLGEAALLLAKSSADAESSMALRRAARGGRVAPSPMLMNWAQQLLDAAFMVYMQDFFKEHSGKFSTFWLADSSQQRQLNWLNSAYTVVAIIVIVDVSSFASLSR